VAAPAPPDANAPGPIATLLVSLGAVVPAVAAPTATEPALTEFANEPSALLDEPAAFAPGPIAAEFRPPALADVPMAVAACPVACEKIPTAVPLTPLAVTFAPIAIAPLVSAAFAPQPIAIPLFVFAVAVPGQFVPETATCAAMLPSTANVADFSATAVPAPAWPLPLARSRSDTATIAPRAAFHTVR
jgi:hypothetical protein